MAGYKQPFYNRKSKDKEPSNSLVLRQPIEDTELYNRFIGDGSCYFLCDEDYLEKLSEKDISTLAETAELDLLMIPFLVHPTVYMKYSMRVA